MHDNHQPNYHTGHWTGSAQLKVHHDIAEALDNRCMTVLVLLDLSGIFQRYLEYPFQVTGSDLTQMKSYLRDRIQRVTVGNEQIRRSLPKIQCAS